MRTPALIGIAGSGFIGRGLAIALESHEDLALSRVLTRRQIDSIDDFPQHEKLTNSLAELIDHSDLIVECTGDVIYAAEIVNQALAAERVVVTMDAAFHVSVGSYFLNHGVLTEAEGDQPGCVAAMAEAVKEMGLRSVVYGNRKGYYHPNPPIEQMQYWSRKQGVSIEQVTAFTDGTKIQLEAALIANGLGAQIVQEGLLGLEADDLQSGALMLALQAQRLGAPISDYVLAPKAPAGVFVVVECDARQKAAMEYFKLGAGPYYALVRNYHLCHLEIPKTIRRMLGGGRPLLTNSSTPTVSVAAIAKCELRPGQRIRRGIGSSLLRGSAVGMADYPDHVPIGLISNAVIERPVEEGQQLTSKDVHIPDSLALKAWREIAVSHAPIAE